MSPLATFERIKEIAKKRHMSLVEVNDKAGLGTRSIYHWKTKTPTTNNLNAVARVLRVNPDYLRGKTSDPKPTRKQDRFDFDLKDNPHLLDMLSYNGQHLDDATKQMYIRLAKSQILAEKNKGRGKHE